MEKKIMIVDDETVVRKYLKELLTVNGYESDDFPDGLAALRAFQAHSEAYQLVITDQTMPGLLGTELVAELLKVRALPIILCTGYSDVVDRESALRQGVAEFFMKPFSGKELVRAIERVLSATETMHGSPD